jgi:UDP-N-acetylmuramoylalanine--D-glutamate ligase
MKNYQEYFKGKKVTMLGLGLLGGMLNDAIFLLKAGAQLTVTDLKSEEELVSSIKKLQSANKENWPIKFVFGRHEIEDFQHADFILQPGNVSPDSPYLLEAQKNNIPIHESESLFFEYLPKEIITVGITGTRGKSTTTQLIYQILKSLYPGRVHLAGNTQGVSTLVLLQKIKAGDIVVLELDSWCLHGMGEVKKSPDISVFTNFMPDHLNFYLKGLPTELNPEEQHEKALESYFNDKANIYKYQKEGDVLVCGPNVAKKIGKTISKKIIARVAELPRDWKIKIPGEHNRQNIISALKAVEAVLMKINPDQSTPWCTLKKLVEGFGGVEGRLQLIREYKGIKIYNDTTSTTPDALEVALKSLAKEKKAGAKLIAISGGADKKLDNMRVAKSIFKYADRAFLLIGTGTDTIKDAVLKKMKDKAGICDSLKQAVFEAISSAKRGDIVVLSPGFASFGMFKNEFDRGDKFNKLIKALK